MRALPEHRASGGIAVTPPAPAPAPIPAQPQRRRATFLPFAPPLVGQEEIDEVVDTLRSDWITTGPKTRRFETEFAAYLAAPGALALNSCTAALHTALVTLGIGPGDEVLTTPMTFAASVNVIEHTGARPVLVDVEPDTLNLDPQRLEAAVTARTKAVLPVHYAGHPVDLDAIREVAEAHRLAVIEDAAHALPARYKGRLIGSGPNPVAFSFYATKNLTTGEGGMLTAEPALLDRARVVSLHGMSRDAWRRYDQGGSWHYDILLPGFKYNMTDIQAALGLRQLEKLASFQRRRRQVSRAMPRASPTWTPSSCRSSGPTWSTPGTSTCCASSPRRCASTATASSRSSRPVTSGRRSTSSRSISTLIIATATATLLRASPSPGATTAGC